MQIDKLNALGMRWVSSADVTWDKYYNAAKAYYEAHGDLKPQAVYIDENGVSQTILSGSYSFIESTDATPKNLRNIDSIVKMVEEKLKEK